MVILIGFIAMFFLFISSFVFKLYLPNMKGYVGEKRINKILGRLGEGYKVFHDLYVEMDDGSTTQIDHVVLSRYGIFVIETKNYSGWIFGNERQKNWTQVIYKNKQQFLNPIWQNKKHVRGLKSFLQLDESYHSIIVFSDNVTFKFKSEFTEAKVIKNNQLMKTIKKYTEKEISTELLNKADQKLQQLLLTNERNKSEIKRNHIKQIKGKGTKPTVNKNEQKQKKICMKCGKAMVVKKGKYGAFYGCINYPACTYTEKA